MASEGGKVVPSPARILEVAKALEAVGVRVTDDVILSLLDASNAQHSSRILSRSKKKFVRPPNPEESLKRISDAIDFLKKDEMRLLSSFPSPLRDPDTSAVQTPSSPSERGADGAAEGEEEFESFDPGPSEVNSLRKVDPQKVNGDKKVNQSSTTRKSSRLAQKKARLGATSTRAQRLNERKSRVEVIKRPAKPKNKNSVPEGDNLLDLYLKSTNKCLKSFLQSLGISRPSPSASSSIEPEKTRECINIRKKLSYEMYQHLVESGREMDIPPKQYRLGFSSDSGTMYVIEDILEVNPAKRRCRVKWKGFPERLTTWEKTDTIPD